MEEPIEILSGVFGNGTRTLSGVTGIPSVQDLFGPISDSFKAYTST